MAVDQSVARIHHGRLADGHVLCLRFRDLQLGLQLRELRDLAERGAGGHFLSFFNRRGQRLQHAFGAGADLEFFHFLLLELVLRLQLIDLHLLRGQLRLDRLLVDGQALRLRSRCAWRAPAR